MTDPIFEIVLISFISGVIAGVVVLFTCLAVVAVINNSKKILLGRGDIHDSI